MKFSFLKSTSPYLNLAIEEYLLKNSEEEYFLLWQNEPTVVIGKNQNAFAEINLDYTKENDIHIVRRITGGGAVYHDFGNLNYSYISKKQGSNIDFQRFSRPVIEALSDMGISAKLSGRNDILIDEKKISGNAQTHFGDRVLHHGTLLFDSDLDALSLALRVDKKKIETKAIKSTRSRVVNIKNFLDPEYTIFDFVEKIKSHILSRYNAAEIAIDKNELITEFEKRNASNEWLFPERDYISRFSLKVKERYDFGTVSISFNMKKDTIADAKIEGDFFGTSDISLLENVLIGNSLSQLESAISNIKISDYIFGMSNCEFIQLIKT